MMEQAPQFPSSPEVNKDPKETKKKKDDKKLARFSLPIAEISNSEKPKPAKLENVAERSELLANLGISEAAIPTKETEKITTETTAKLENAYEKTESADTGELEDEPSEADGVEYQDMPEFTGSYHELSPTEFSGGEVVIQLHEPVESASASIEAEETRDEEPQIFTPQPEQQHQARVEAEDPLPEAVPGNTGNVPPTVPPTGPEATLPEPPEPERPSVIAPDLRDYENRIYSQPVLQSAERNPQDVVTKEQLENAVHSAAKAGQNRGVLAGLIVGGGYEHFKHKRKEKRQQKRFDIQQKHVEKLKTDNTFLRQEQLRQAEKVNQNNELAKNNLKPEKSTEKRPKRIITAENPEQLVVPADHRLETSAWHTIEIDSKTGKPVENPTFEYGHEYYRERAAENVPVEQRNVAAGSAALIGATGLATSTPAAQLAASSPTPDGSAQGRAAKNSQTTVGTRFNAAAKATKPIWPWSIALIVVIVCLFILL